MSVDSLYRGLAVPLVFSSTGSVEGILFSLGASLLFSCVGMVIFFGGFYVIRKMLPFDVHKEIEVDQNTALGLVVASFILGLAFIIGMSIHG